MATTIKSNDVAPNLKKYQITPSGLAAIEKQKLRTPEGKWGYWGPFFKKKAQKYYFKKMTDELVGELFTTEGNFASSIFKLASENGTVVAKKKTA